MLSIDPAIASAAHPSWPIYRHLNRACEHCRTLKVRCLSDDASPTGQCQRCSKAGQACIFEAPRRRRPRKRNDTRVAELEREVQAVKSLLNGGRGRHNAVPSQEDIGPGLGMQGTGFAVESQNKIKPGTGEGGSEGADDGCYGLSSLSKSRPWTTSQNVSTTRPYPTPAKVDVTLQSAQTSDVVDRGMISMPRASDLVDVYRKDIVQHFPGVVIQSDWSAWNLRLVKPVLFLAVITAASVTEDCSFHSSLSEELAHVFAHRIFVNGETSLELIQSLLITIAYHNPAESLWKALVVQYAHTAATMALEIGIVSKPQQEEHSANVLAENCRTLLTCYLVCAGLAMRLRRPKMLLFSNWMGECLEMLEKSPVLLDQRLAAYVKLQRIADDACTSFGFDDASTNTSLTDSRMQAIVKGFERQMEEWKRTTAQEAIDDVSITLDFHHNCMCLYNFAMEDGHHNYKDFIQRISALPSGDDDAGQYMPQQLLCASRVNATMKYISSTHAFLDAFVGMDTKILRTVPVLNCIMAGFAMVGLFAIFSEITSGLTSLRDLVDCETLKLDFYLDAVLQRVAEAIGPKKCRERSKWLELLTMVKARHEQHLTRLSEDRGESQGHPRTGIMQFHDKSQPSHIEALQRRSLHTPTIREGSTSTQTSHLDILSDSASQERTHNETQERLDQLMPTPFLRSSDFATQSTQDDLFFRNDTYSNDIFSGWMPEDANLYGMGIADDHAASEQDL